VGRQDFSFVNAIVEHSAGFAAAARGHLDAKVEHCPGWSVADLVWHLTEVQWFWATVAEERRSGPPEDSERPVRPADEELIEAFEAGAEHLADVLRRTPYRDRAWTWAPAQQDVAFIARHQVQEAAVHHWDAAHAAGVDVTIRPEVAADAVEEFLTFSVSSAADPAEPARPPLQGSFTLLSTDADLAWHIEDADPQGTIRFTASIPDDRPAIAAKAPELLLWLYQRIDLDTSAVDPELVARFRALTFTT
jgi:uncharacterized protein (TIGR03083 family)